MAITRTSRFSLHRWDSGTDPLNREQFDTDNAQVEALAGIFRSGVVADIGDPTLAAYARSFFYATDTAILYFSDGSLWVPLNDYGETGDIASLSIGGSASAGTVGSSGTLRTVEYALANHSHAMPSAATPVSVGTANAAGSASTISRSDHVHLIGSGAINSSAMFSSGVVDSTALASSAVTAGKIATGGISASTQFASGVVNAAAIGTDAVTTVKILDSNVTEAKIADYAVTATKIGPTTVDAAKTSNYTLALTDRNKMLRMSTASTFQVPTNASVAFPVGSMIHLMQTTTNQVTVAAVTPATTTVNSALTLKLRTQWSSATLLKIDTDTWVLFGDLAAA